MAENKNNEKISGNGKNFARAIGRDLPISIKTSINVCNFIRGISVERAKKILDNAISKKQAIPYRRFTMDLGHKRNIGPGRYPVKACTHILEIIKSAEANAKNIGLSTKGMVIEKLIANRAARPFRYGRKRRIKMKRTHIEVVVSEGKK